MENIINYCNINIMKERAWILLSRVLEAILFIMGIWSIWKGDWLWVFACFFGFFLSISPVILKRNLKFSVHWLIELLLVFAISLHVWGGVLHLYSLPFYDKIAHFLASAIVAFFALIAVYILDVFSPRIHMDLVMIGFFIAIFTIAMGGMWEIAEFISDQIFSGGKPVAQVSLNNTMLDLIADAAAGILMGIVGTIGIRRGEFKDILLQFGGEAKKLNTRFLNARNRAIESLRKAIMEGKVDAKAIPIVKKINSISDYFTTSSCSGRIAVMEMPSFGRKRKAKFLGKWHGKVSVNEVKKALEKRGNGEIWFLVQSPIFHVASISMENAKKLLNIANQSGFKYSTIKSINGKIMVEILGTERIDAPLGVNGRIYGGEEYVEVLVEIANKMMERMERNMKRLEKNLEMLRMSA